MVTLTAPAMDTNFQWRYTETTRAPFTSGPPPKYFNTLISLVCMFITAHSRDFSKALSTLYLETVLASVSARSGLSRTVGLHPLLRWSTFISLKWGLVFSLHFIAFSKGFAQRDIPPPHTDTGHPSKNDWGRSGCCGRRTRMLTLLLRRTKAKDETEETKWEREQISVHWSC